MSNTRGHVYPAWAGALLVSPFRRRRLDPEALLNPLIRPGMAIADIGCGFGFFSLPLARAAGPEGRVFCIDAQAGMLEGLRKRAAKAGLADHIALRRCDPATLGALDLDASIDFALAYNVVHEIGDATRFLNETRALLKAGGRLLVCEPRGHVDEGAFAKLLSEAEALGFASERAPSLRGELCSLLRKA
jgi:ubiquinone/menaquinone biosynthesis C-methylase UbiE